MSDLPFSWAAFENGAGVRLSANAKRRIMAMVREPSASAWERCRSIAVTSTPRMGTLWYCAERATLRPVMATDVPSSHTVVRALAYAAGLPEPRMASQ